MAELADALVLGTSGLPVQVQVLLSAFRKSTGYLNNIYADVAELADAPDLGSGVYDVQVQVLSSAGNEE